VPSPRSPGARSPGRRSPAAARSPRGGGGGGGGSANDAPEGIGDAATIRYQKARLKVLEEELVAHAQRAKQLEEQLAAANAAARDAVAEKKKLARQLGGATASAEKHRALADEAQREADALRAQAGRAAKDLKSAERAKRAAEGENQSRDVRLNRALEEIERLRGLLREARAQQQEGKDFARERSNEQLEEIRRLERQRAELLSAFRKQLKLIDVLKRQKVHIEASRLLSFTEEEFSKTLELGSA